MKKRQKFKLNTGEFSMKNHEQWQEPVKFSEPAGAPQPATAQPEPIVSPTEPSASQAPDCSTAATTAATQGQSGKSDSRPVQTEQNIEEKLRDAEAKIAQMQDAFLRAKAELENVRRHAQEDIARAHKLGIENFSESLLPVKDSLEAALKIAVPSIESLKDGVEATLKQMTSSFEKNKLTEINPLPGEKLDPMKHQVISMEPSEQNANTIVTVLQKGYMIADRLLRPALVTVAQEKTADNSS
jgi:molecular chaperone GrpE